MKKLVAVLLSCLMVMGMLAACGSSAPAETKAPETTAAAAPETTAAAAETTVAAEAGFTTIEAGKLIMSTNAAFPPYEMVADDGSFEGIDVEVAGAIAAKLGYDFEIADMDFDSIIPAIQSGKASFGMAGMTVTDERAMLVNFSEPYATGKQVVIVKEDSDITSVDDLFADGAMHTIGVQQATTGDLYVTWDLVDTGKAVVNPYLNGNEAVMALLTGKVDCVVIDNEPAKAYVAANEGLKILETEYVTENYAACFSKSNTELLEKFNQAMKELTEDGTIPAIIEKYIPSEVAAQ